MSRLRSLSIGLRLALAFGFVCLACALVALVGVSSSRTLTTDIDNAVEMSHSVELLSTLTADATRTSGDVARHLYVYDGDLAAQDELAKEIDEREAHATKTLK